MAAIDARNLPATAGSARVVGALSAEQQAQVESLKKRDREVRQHEMAHLAASGGMATGGPSYQMVVGPDGQRYAVAGEVKIDLSEGRTPEETIRKARIIQAAALAPASPSGADRAVAAAARTMEIKAQAEIAARSTQETQLAGSYQPQDEVQSRFATEA